MVDANAGQSGADQSSDATSSADATFAAGADTPTVGDVAIYCPDCGYDLRGRAGERCAECGLLLDFLDSDAARVPWERRREIGRLRGLYGTAWVVTFRPKRFCRAIYRPVSYPDSQRFRWVAIAHAWVGLLIGATMMHAYQPAGTEELVEFFGAWIVPMLALCTLLFLVVFTGVPSYFFHPKYLSIAQQNRAVALSYYANGPLLITPILVPGAILIGMAWSTPKDVFFMVLLALPAGFSVFLLCTGTYTMVMRFVLRRSLRVNATELLLVVIWLVGLVLTFAIPLAIFSYLLLVYYSLRDAVGVG